MHTNHPIDPVEVARAIVLAADESDLAAERNTARVVSIVRACVARYGEAFPIAVRVRSLQQREGVANSHPPGFSR